MHVAFVCYVLRLLTADPSGPELPFNLSVFTCLLLSHAWNTNVANVNANQSLTIKQHKPAVMVKGRKPFCLLCSRSTRSGALPPVVGNNGFLLVLSASCWKESVNKLFLLWFSLILHMCAEAGIPQGSNYALLQKTKGDQYVWNTNVCWRWKWWIFFFLNVTCAAFEDETQPYHADPFVARLCSGEIDCDLSCFSPPAPVFMGCRTETQDKKKNHRLGPS